MAYHPRLSEPPPSSRSKKSWRRKSYQTSDRLPTLGYRPSSAASLGSDDSLTSIGSGKDATIIPPSPPPLVCVGYRESDGYPQAQPKPPPRRGSLRRSVFPSRNVGSRMGRILEVDSPRKTPEQREEDQGLLSLQGSRLILESVTSESDQHPMMHVFMEDRIPNFARETPQDVSETVSRAGRILDERRQSNIQAKKGRGARFWLTFFAVFVTAFLSAVDLTIISPILPTIAADMPPSTISATWITSAFLATSASFQPLFGGLSDAIGRRESLLLSIAIFLAGSVVACLARDMLGITIGRGVQGLGGGGMLVVGEIIISDMTTLAERGYFLGILSIAFATAALAAPIAGGWFATFNWRLAFYINFPIGLVAILMLLPAKLAKPKLSLKEKIQRTDVLGSSILFGSITSLLIGLTNGGVQSPWLSLKILFPLASGVFSLLLFFMLEAIPNPLSKYPILPAKLFRHRTAAIAYLLTFLHGILLYGATQGLVLYFENRGATPLKAAINILPANAPSTPAAFIAGILMAVTGKYKAQIVVCEGLMTLGVGLLILLETDSPTWQWASFQLIASVGLGALYSLTLPPIQATLPAHELAHATATFAFARSFGAVWGVSAFLIAFQAQSGQHLDRVPGADAAGITGATAIDFVPRLAMLPDSLREPLSEVFQDAIRVGFMVLVPFAFAGFLASWFIIHVPLPAFNDSRYGLEGQNLSSTQGRQMTSEDVARGHTSPFDDASQEEEFIMNTLKSRIASSNFSSTSKPVGSHSNSSSLNHLDDYPSVSESLHGPKAYGDGRASPLDLNKQFALLQAEIDGSNESFFTNAARNGDVEDWDDRKVDHGDGGETVSTTSHRHQSQAGHHHNSSVGSQVPLLPKAADRSNRQQGKGKRMSIATIWGLEKGTGSAQSVQNVDCGPSGETSPEDLRGQPPVRPPRRR